MSRRLAAVLFGALLALSAVPALGHSVSYTTRETGNAECSFDEDVRTEIRAIGHHRHTRVGIQSVFLHTGTDVWSFTPVHWSGVFAMQWSTANQTGYGYDYLGSGWGGCV